MSGNLNVENVPFKTPLMKEFLKTSSKFGYKITDPNGRKVLGFSQTQATMREGRRCSTAKAYIDPITYRSNLKISLRTRVTKILIDPVTKEAYGVEFLKNRRRFVVRARKEIILSAGSFNSPQLLMLSGVGPRDLLEEKYIPVIQDLKVGYNLQDHFATSAQIFLANESVSISDTKAQNPIYVLQYLFGHTGPYTVPSGAEALAFIKTKLSENKTDDYPDIELVLGSGAYNGDSYGTVRRVAGIPDSLYNEVYEPVNHIDGFSIVPVIMRPKSRGRVTIKDKNPLHWPLIQPNYLSDRHDLLTMVEGIKAVSYLKFEI